jgi:hypothetical protein
MIFNLNDCEELKLNNEKIYIFNSFYNRPNKIFEYLLNIDPILHRGNNTLNGKMFLDLRHNGHIDELNEMIEHFENFTNQKCTHKDNNLKTNMQKWFDNDFNNYRDNYWWPHYDDGYTLLIYLNDNNKDNGLNLYEDTPYYDKQSKLVEHINPWHNKSNYKLLKHIETPFNTAILFNANKFLHGCSINNKNNFKYFRLNQAVFFKDHK